MKKKTEEKPNCGERKSWREISSIVNVRDHFSFI